MDMKSGKKISVMACAALLTVSGTLFAAENSSEKASLDAEVVEYNMETGMSTATGNVVMVKGNSTVTGNYAEFNTKTKDGKVTGNVVAVKDDMRMSAEMVSTDGGEHMIAVGSVRGTKADKHFAGPRVEYFDTNQYVLIPSGGSITAPEGTFTADRMEGYLQSNHIIGTGNAHMVSPPNNMEAGGDKVDYYGDGTGKAVLTGNAWAIQDNNTLKSKKLTVFLADNGKAKVQ
ncbi:MAG: organic solvent tolerance protein OstA [Anaerovibrio sp.]|uniref:LptA/OstA family protein n=1 Tax=Anaerovibrio sp. TaxID=1872532 RepID=UPI0025F17AC7|nr:LptA/OstA family protein [Anaerovibrio sp.]MCR5176177.1 organic solvent tolerance protein OstA [Anaerovibrio sp.]